MVHSRASRTRRIASSGCTPNSTSRRAVMVPARPRPPRQWSSTSKPSRSRFLMDSPVAFQACSKSCSGASPSGIGACHHSMCRSRTRRVQKHKRVAKPLMVALSMIMTDELGDGLARGS